MIPEIMAEVQITYSSHVKSRDRIKVCSSNDAAEAFRQIWPAYDHIEFSYMLMMNRQNQILGYFMLSKGGMCGTVVDVRVIYQVALKACATGIILAHNHPSGQLQCSDADRKVTNQIKQAGILLDIPLLDHLIMTTDSFYSMADEGIL